MNFTRILGIIYYFSEPKYYLYLNKSKIHSFFANPYWAEIQLLVQPAPTPGPNQGPIPSAGRSSHLSSSFHFPVTKAYQQESAKSQLILFLSLPRGPGTPPVSHFLPPCARAMDVRLRALLHSAPFPMRSAAALLSLRLVLFVSASGSSPLLRRVVTCIWFIYCVDRLQMDCLDLGSYPTLKFIRT